MRIGVALILMVWTVFTAVGEEWTGMKTMETVPTMRAEKNVFLVTGDAARNKELCLPGGGWTTIKIDLPKNWDELMRARGYRPLSDFYLQGSRLNELE